MFGYYGLEDIVPYVSPCIVLRDPDTDKRCGGDASGKTVLDEAICAECFAAVAA